MIWIAGILIALTALVFAYLQHPKFGSLPTGSYKHSLEQSPNYGSDGFENLIDTPMFADNQSFTRVLWQNLRAMGIDLSPISDIPSDSETLSSLKQDENVLIWLGHSSFYIQFNGQRILIDPVFGPNAAPVPGIIPAYAGTTPLSADNFDEIDTLLITHDHWDHLDYETLKSLQPKVRRAITPLGVGAYLREWGYDPASVSEGDWYDSYEIATDIRVHLVPARHYSGRLLKRSQTLWAGFVIETPEYQMLISGDTGYGPHFKEIANKFGNFDLVALDQGQYDPRWPYIHMTPDEALQAAQELRSARLLPAHVGKFTLAKHHWMEPFTRIAALAENSDVRLVTPMIGASVTLNRDSVQTFEHWWEHLPKAAH